MTITKITNANELPANTDLHIVHKSELDTVPDDWQVWVLGKMCWVGKVEESEA